MSKTKYSNIVQGNTHFFSAEVPIICPHCGAFITPVVRGISDINIPRNHFYLVIFSASCCEKLFLATYKVDSKVTDREGELLTVYPSISSAVLPNSVHEISPRFINLYNQAYLAEQNNCIELAGSGYRNSIEVLIKDYAIKELGKSPDEVSKKKLFDAIQEYMTFPPSHTSANVLRIIGNDFTHYERRYDIDFNIFKIYIDIFIKSIDCEYLIKHPVVDVPDPKK